MSTNSDYTIYKYPLPKRPTLSPQKIASPKSCASIQNDSTLTIETFIPHQTHPVSPPVHAAVLSISVSLPPLPPPRGSVVIGFSSGSEQNRTCLDKRFRLALYGRTMYPLSVVCPDSLRRSCAIVVRAHPTEVAFLHVFPAIPLSV